MPDFTPSWYGLTLWRFSLPALAESRSSTASSAAYPLFFAPCGPPPYQTRPPFPRPPVSLSFGSPSFFLIRRCRGFSSRFCGRRLTYSTLRRLAWFFCTRSSLRPPYEVSTLAPAPLNRKEKVLRAFSGFYDKAFHCSGYSRRKFRSGPQGQAVCLSG